MLRRSDEDIDRLIVAGRASVREGRARAESIAPEDKLEVNGVRPHAERLLIVERSRHRDSRRRAHRARDRIRDRAGICHRFEFQMLSEFGAKRRRRCPTRVQHAVYAAGNGSRISTGDSGAEGERAVLRTCRGESRTAC
jgi:hypothetical protein